MLVTYFPKPYLEEAAHMVTYFIHMIYMQQYNCSPVRVDDWFLPRNGGLSFGGGGRGPVRP